MHEETPDSPERAGDERESVGSLVRTFGYIGLNSFGGPAGQIAVMHRVLVEEKRWIDDTRFAHALNFCMMLPGPEATQLATYVGWLKRGTLGGLIAGGLFVLPGAACMLVLAWIYAAYGSVSVVVGVLVGLKSAVIVMVAMALVRIGKRVLRTRLAIGLAIVGLAAQVLFHAPFPLLVGVALAIGLVVGTTEPDALGVHTGAYVEDVPARPTPGVRRTALVAIAWLGLWLAPLALMVGVLSMRHVLSREAILFSKAAVVTFGGAYAVLGYIGDRAGAESWLTPPDMVSGLALAETTPGPLILVGQFVAFVGAYRTMTGVPPVLAGVGGAAVFLWATFVPCFLWIFVGAPYMERLRASRRAGAMLAAVSAAVVGVIANLALWLALHTLFGVVDERTFGPVHVPVVRPDSFVIPAAVLMAMAGALMGWLKWPPGRSLFVCAIAGAAWTMLAPTAP